MRRPKDTPETVRRRIEENARRPMLSMCSGTINLGFLEELAREAKKRREGAIDVEAEVSPVNPELPPPTPLLEDKR
jgi:hypothetical protein